MRKESSSGIIDRLKLRWRHLTNSGPEEPDTLPLSPNLPPEDFDLMRRQMLACLDGVGGEVTARNRAAALGRSYLQLNKEGRSRFIKFLAEEFCTDDARVDAEIAAVRGAKSREDRIRAECRLKDALVAPRVRLLTQFNALPEGVKFLVDMRAELLPLAKGDAMLQALEDDLRDLLAAWFDVGFLELQRITWSSPAALLEKIIAYEAVHTIQNWQDLKNRLDADRRLFAFIHPRMPEEPLIFVEVALVKGIAGNIHELLDQNAPVGKPEEADTAIFYSISNAQRGLAGISFGNFLIKRVVDYLMREFPNLRQFATLSPIPGFRVWFDARLKKGELGGLTPAEHKAITAYLPGKGAKGGLKALLDRSEWQKDSEAAELLKAPMMRFCARYLALEKRQGEGGAPKALDPVAHFHLSNGARIERLDWLADVSPKGMKQSAGMMVNYLYKLADIDANHEAYSGEGKVAMSGAIKALLKD